MSIETAYWARLSEKHCPVCGSHKLDPDGDFNYACRNCGHVGDVFDNESYRSDDDDYDY